jgi:hypothetical protein
MPTSVDAEAHGIAPPPPMVPYPISADPPIPAPAGGAADPGGPPRWLKNEPPPRSPFAPAVGGVTVPVTRPPPPSCSCCCC